MKGEAEDGTPLWGGKIGEKKRLPEDRRFFGIVRLG